MQRPVFLNADLEAELIRKGFVTVRLLDEAEVASLNERLEAARTTSPEDSNIVGQGLTYHSSTLDPNRQYRTETFSAVRDAVANRLASIVDDFDIVIAGS